MAIVDRMRAPWACDSRAGGAPSVERRCHPPPRVASIDAVMEEKSSDERAHCPALFPVIDSGNALRGNKFDRPSRFMPPSVKQHTFRRFSDRRGEEKAAVACVPSDRSTTSPVRTPRRASRWGVQAGRTGQEIQAFAAAPADAIVHPESRGQSESVCGGRSSRLAANLTC
jgi:hypothetical protein